MKIFLKGRKHPTGREVEIEYINNPKSFDPSSLTKLALWLDASDKSMINDGTSSDEDPVSLWVDKSNNKYNAVQAVNDNRPIYKIGIENGLGIIRFGQPPNYTTPAFLELNGEALNLFRNVDAFTLAVAFRGIAADDYLFLASNNDNSKNRVFAETNAPNFRLSVSNDDDTEAQSSIEASLPVSTPNSDFTAQGFCSVVGVCDLIGGKIGINSSNTFNTANDIPFQTYSQFVATPGATPNTASSKIRIGANVLDEVSPFSGDLGELLIYQRFLNSFERRQLLEYLSAKWKTL